MNQKKGIAKTSEKMLVEVIMARVEIAAHFGTLMSACLILLFKLL